MKKLRILAARFYENSCPERGCVVLDQPQHLAKAWLSGISHTLRLAFNTATLLSAGSAIMAMLMFFPASAQAQGGVPLWTNVFPGIGPYPGSVTAMAVDRSGNVFVSSSSFGIVKYSNDGVPLWTNLDGGAIAVDANGKVFVSGNGTVAYSSAGVPLWTNAATGNAIAVDSSGNVFVSGDGATVAYSNAGMPLWTNYYLVGGVENAVNSIGNVFVTGESSGGSSSSDYGTVAYSNAGVPLWTNRYSGPGNSYDVAEAIAVDSSGNVFVTGRSSNGTNEDYVTIKYSSSVPPPRLDFQLVSNQLVLNWTNSGFSLQSAPAVTGPFTNLPAATSPYTNPLTAPQQFFRLIAN